MHPMPDWLFDELAAVAMRRMKIPSLPSSDEDMRRLGLPPLAEASVEQMLRAGAAPEHAVRAYAQVAHEWEEAVRGAIASPSQLSLDLASPPGVES